MRQIIRSRTSDPSPEETFATKYTWLLRWALHFAQNDRPTAEDLVQETFVRMLLSWESLEDIHNLEPFLYSHLRYAYLTEKRRNGRLTFQSLSAIDGDALPSMVVTHPTFRNVEVQNELRTILTFLLWKCRTTKFASIFLLRFFLGFFPEEIARICRSTRHSVDLGLRHARAEIKAYLLDPNCKQMPEGARRLDLSRHDTAIPVHEFTEELRHQVVCGPRHACFPAHILQRLYDADSQKPIEVDLLAHIVTCGHCLELVAEYCGVQQHSPRSVEDSLNSAPRLKENNRIPRGKSNAVQIATVVPFMIALVAALGGLLWSRNKHTQEHAGFSSFLRLSVNAEEESKAHLDVAAVHQQIQISAGNMDLQRDLYRDPQGHRRAKQRPVDQDERMLHRALVDAQVDWNNPLSASDFQLWHDHLRDPSDLVRETPNLLIFTTTSQAGPIQSESLTVRAGDFHSIARSITLRNNQQIEVAELSYEEVSSRQSTDPWFEPLKGNPKALASSLLERHVTPVSTLSESQFDLATLSALRALQELHAETERLELIRTPQAVQVRGVVAAIDRKQEIAANLRTIANVTVDIATYQELDEKSALSSSIHAIKAVSVISGDSPLENYCALAHIAQDDCRHLTYRLLNTATTLVLESKRLSQLNKQYPTTKSITPAAREVLARLINVHIEHLVSSVDEQEKIVALFAITTERGDTLRVTDESMAVEDKVLQAAQQNLSLIHDLVSASSDQTRGSSARIDSLPASVTRMREAIRQVSASDYENASTLVKTSPPR